MAKQEANAATGTHTDALQKQRGSSVLLSAVHVRGRIVQERAGNH